MASYMKTYRFRMAPSKSQIPSLLRMAGARRFVWNWALARRKSHYEATGKNLPPSRLSAELTEMKSKPETSWLKDMYAQSLQQVLRDLDRTFAGFFAKRAKFPRFKSKKSCRPSFRVPQGVKVEQGKVWVPKVGWVRFRQSQTIDGRIRHATFKRDHCGDWFVHIATSFEMPDVQLPPPNPVKAVGVDAGLIDFIVFSNGERIKAPKFCRANEKKMIRAQKTFGRRKIGSRRRERARTAIARIGRRIANKRSDFLHKLSISTIRSFEVVCIESINYVGLAKSKLAKSFYDAGHGEFRRQLRYKAEWNRRHVVLIDRFFPSSKTCHECGVVAEKIALSARSWTCSGCGVVLDRDLNAARNIRDEGLRNFAAGHAENRNAQGVSVRPATAGAKRRTENSEQSGMPTLHSVSSGTDS